MMAKSSGMGGMNSMPSSESSMNSSPDMMDEDSDDEQGDKSSKMMALNNILGSLGEIVSDDLKPHIEEMQRDLRMKSGEKDPSDPMQGDDSDEDGMPPAPQKGALDVTIGMGAKPPMSGMPGMGDKSDSGEEDEDENLPKGGFLSILAKKMKKK